MEQVNGTEDEKMKEYFSQLKHLVEEKEQMKKELTVDYISSLVTEVYYYMNKPVPKELLEHLQKMKEELELFENKTTITTTGSREMYFTDGGSTKVWE
jgi:nitrogen fixation/metabolism regulation signal transduction histidine kinase